MLNLPAAGSAASYPTARLGGSDQARFGTDVVAQVLGSSSRDPGAILVFVVAILVLLGIGWRAYKALRPRVTSVDDVEGSTGLVVIGTVYGRGLRRPILSMNGQLHRPASDDLTQICRMLRHNGLGTGIRVLTVVPTGTRRQPSTFATRLASTLAEDGQDVLLVLANMRQPGTRSAVSPYSSMGLAQLLEQDCSGLVTSLVSVAEHLLVLPSGTSEADPAVLLARPVLKDVITSLRRLGPVVIIDAPPSTFAEDVLPLARNADATLLIVQAGTPWKDVEEAARELRYDNVNAPAAVLVGTRRRSTLAVGRSPRRGIIHSESAV